MCFMWGKMEQIKQETEARNLRAPEKKPTSGPPTSFGMSGIQSDTTYYPMGGAYSQEELHAMMAANLEKYAELQGKPTIDERIQKNPLYQWFAPRLAIYNSITETAKDLWHEIEFYKLVKSKVDWAVDKYMGIWDTVETAWKITTNKNSTYWQKLGANIFIGLTIVSHFMLAVGLVLLAIATLKMPVFKLIDFVDNATTLVTAPIQYASGKSTIGELGFQVIVSSLDLELPGGKRAGDLIGNSALEMGLRNIDDAMDVVNPSKIPGNLDELGETLDLFSDYGKPAAQLLDSVDVNDARKLLDNLDVGDVDNLLKLDSNVIKSIAELDDVAIKGLSGKLDVIIDLGDDAIKQVNQHGAGLLPFLNNYTDKGLQLINSSDEAAEFVLKHWDDAPDKVDLAVDFGKPAIQLMDSVDATGARKLLDNLNAADIENIIKLDGKIINNLADMDPVKLNGLIGKFDVIADFGDDAIAQVNRYGPEIIPVLFEHGDEGVEFIKLFEGDLAKVIVDYRCGKFAGELSEEGESILSYLSNNADNLMLSTSEAKLLSYSDEIVNFNQYITTNNGLSFEITEEQTAEQVNQWFKDTKGYVPVTLPDTEAYKVKLNSDTNFVRVYTDDGQHGLYGGFIMLEEDIVGLTADEIQNMYALDFKPKFVADVNLKAGDEIRFSVTNENYGFFGGAIQIDMIDQRIGSFEYKCKIEELVPNGN